MPWRPGSRPVAMVDQAGALFMLGTLSRTPSAPPSRREATTGRRPARASGPATDHVPPSQPTTSVRVTGDEAWAPWVRKVSKWVNRYTVGPMPRDVLALIGDAGRAHALRPAGGPSGPRPW